MSPRPRVHGKPLWGRTAYPEETGYFLTGAGAGAAAGAAAGAGAASAFGASAFFDLDDLVDLVDLVDFFAAGAALSVAGAAAFFSIAGAAFFSAAGAAAGAAFSWLDATAKPATENTNATAITTAKIFFISFPLQREYLDA